VLAGLAPSSQTVGCKPKVAPPHGSRNWQKLSETGRNRWKTVTLFYPDPKMPNQFKLNPRNK